MLEVGQRHPSSRSGTWIEITDRSDGKLSFERGYAPHTGRADAHYHLDFTQIWEALEGAGELRIRGSFEPCTPFIESFAEVWAHHLREGTVDDQDQIPLIQILVIAEETGAQSYAAGPPRFLQRVGLPLIAAFGRLRGYKPSYD